MVDRQGLFISVLQKEFKNSVLLLYISLREVFVFILFVRLAILRYLSQKYTNFAGWGKEPEDRYRVHSVLDWANSKLLKYKNRSFLTSKKP